MYKGKVCEHVRGKVLVERDSVCVWAKERTSVGLCKEVCVSV